MGVCLSFQSKWMGKLTIILTPLSKSIALLTSPEQQKVGRIKISCVCELFVLNSKKFTIKILVLGNYRLHFCYEVKIPLIRLNYVNLDLQTRKSIDLGLQF